MRARTASVFWLLATSGCALDVAASSEDIDSVAVAVGDSQPAAQPLKHERKRPNLLLIVADAKDRGYESSYVLLGGVSTHFAELSDPPTAQQQRRYRENGAFVTPPADFYSTEARSAVRAIGVGALRPAQRSRRDPRPLAQYPELRAELIAAWEQSAADNGVIPVPSGYGDF